MNIRNRILRLEHKPASSIRPSPLNWRTHPKEQADALRGVLVQIGFAGAVLARQLEDGTLEAIDGHLRLETMGDEVIPVLVTDLTAEEAKVLLATFDPIGDMATADTAKLEELLTSIKIDSPAMQLMLDELAAANGILQEPEPEVKEPVKKPTTPTERQNQFLVLCDDDSSQEWLMEELVQRGFRVMTLSPQQA